MKELLRVEGISKSFGTVQALSKVSLDLHEGELVSIVGENGAGKSTLMNVITGIHQPDEGQILVEGQQLHMTSPLDAIRAGVAIVHQEMVNCPDITVAENIFMSAIVGSKAPFVDYRKLNREAAKLLANFEARISPTTLIGHLSVSEQQVVEIAKALSTNAKIIIFDEPTSSLTEDEVKRLFEIINKLRADGIGILYISHRMSEIFALSDRVVILRDGMHMDTLPIGALTEDLIVSKMTGRQLGDYCPPKAETIGGLILAVRDYCGEMFQHVDFTLREGEILGFSGLIGAGRSEVMKAMVGLLPSRSGEIELRGERYRFKHYAEALKAGVVYLTEDRKQEGLFLRMNIEENMSILNLPLISGRMFVKQKLQSLTAKTYSEKMNVKASGLQQLVGTLSGGNQQKVLIGNALSISPRIIILDEPTRGIDVGAKAEIYRILRDMAASGVGVIVVSSDLPEVIGLCDRVEVMYEGRLMGEVTGEDINEQSILQIASGLNGQRAAV